MADIMQDTLLDLPEADRLKGNRIKSGTWRLSLSPRSINDVVNGL
jgi:hypothetical protein